ncbi:DUF2066 domain-containing protein [Pseudomonas sp. ABC1]|nr:DUF2066 domain-containing protein [Pseudomonas sp. ABC1]QLF92166.1 DUF2066 domain-containing protein [Pseudomonas sp. ABC1]
MYQVSEPVTGQQAEARAEAMQHAFDTLLLRLTGSDEGAAQADVAALRKDPKSLVRQYSYDGDRLVVDFDPVATEQRLRQAGLALWGQNRPALLLWWLGPVPDGDEDAGAQLVGDGQAGAAMLREASLHRGLPLLLPLADLQEQLLATPEALGQADGKELHEAAERYAADALLAVVASESDGKWSATWRLWLGEDAAKGKVSGKSQEALADAVLLAASRAIAPHYVVAPGAASQIVLEVSGVDVERFAELERLLDAMGATLLRMDGENVAYRLQSRPEQLRAQLQVVGLHELEAESNDPQAEHDEEGVLMRFAW